MSDLPSASEPWVELRLWRQFATLAEELHFGRAAQRLHMTQPPLTQAIAQLEKTLGVRLFDRTKRSVQLTAAGHTLLPLARDLLLRAGAPLTGIALNAVDLKSPEYYGYYGYSGYSYAGVDTSSWKAKPKDEESVKGDPS